jgi:HAD superfamily hydrolase (TIGR01509 family)
MFELFKDFKLAIFDLDGTIVLTNDLWREAISHALEEAAIPATFVNELYSPGTPLSDFYEIYVEGIDQKVKEYLIDETIKYYRELLENNELEVSEGLESFLLFLQKNSARIALVSNSTRETVNMVLSKIGYENIFELSVCGDEVKKKKPDPEMYNKVLDHFKSLRIPKEQIIVFEDSPAGAEAAAKAGLPPLIVNNEEVKKLLYPDNVRGFSDNFANLDYTIDPDLLEQVKRELENLKKETGTNPQTQP